MLLVAQIAERDEQQLADKLGELRQQQHQELAQEQDLQRYLKEYTADLNHQGSGFSAMQLAEGRGFLGRLQEVCDNQHAKILQLEQQISRALQNWQLAHQKTQAIIKLVDKLKTEHSQALEKQLQKELDELSSQRFLNK